jgi:metal-responsive CopG/Arc/MetJ family transcriptional regulator
MEEVKAVKTQIAIRLPEEMLIQIEKLAKWERRNRSNMIEWLIREALRNLEKK